MYFIVAQIVGFVGMGLVMLSYQYKDNRWLILLQVCGIQLLMLGGYTGCITLGIAVLNCLVQCFYGKPWADWWGWKWLFSTAYVAVMLLTWNNFSSLLPCAAAIAGTLSNWTRNGKKIRMSRLFVVGP